LTFAFQRATISSFDNIGKEDPDMARSIIHAAAQTAAVIVCLFGERRVLP